MNGKELYSDAMFLALINDPEKKGVLSIMDFFSQVHGNSFWILFLAIPFSKEHKDFFVTSEGELQIQRVLKGLQGQILHLEA